MKQQFNLLVKPVADACHLDCTYCYFRRTQPKDDSKRMGTDTLEALVKNYHASVRAPAWDWQGGEPCLRGVEFYHEAVTLQWKHPSDQPACNSLQTSGTLLDDEWIKLLKGPGEWVVGLSCDGPTNESRGIPTEDIANAAKLLKAAGVPFSLLCVVSRENVNKPKETVRFLSTLGGHFQAIPCHRKHPGGPDPGPSPDEWWRWLAAAHAVIRDEELPIDFGNALTVADMKRGLPGDCTGQGCGSYLVVSPSGEVHPCDFFVEPNYSLGSIFDASLARLMRSGRMDRFKLLHETKSEGDECSSCAALKVCHRGCPRDRLMVEGSFETHNPYCDGVKFLDRVTQ